MSHHQEEPQNDEIRQGQPIELTVQEMAVLRECRTNSLYLRGLPLGIFSALGTRYLANNYFPHVKRWAGFYYTASFSVGVLLGVGSYKEKCLNKIMSLSDSRLADQVREFRQRAVARDESMGSIYDVQTNKFQQQEVDNTSTNRDNMPPAGSRIPPRFGKFGRHPENADKDEYDEDQEPSKAASYEELRRLHRARQMQGPRRLTKPKQEDEENSEDSTSTYDPDSTYDKRETYSWNSDFKNQVSDDKSELESRGQWPKARIERTKKNKYGDEME